MNAVRARALAFRQALESLLQRLGQFLLRMGGLLLIAFFLSIGLTVIGLLNETVEAWIFSLAAAGAEGVILALFSRRLFPAYSLSLRWTFAAAALITGLLLIGWFTWGYVGIPPAIFMREGPDWASLGQILAGAVVISLTMLAWRSRGQSSSAPIAINPASKAAPISIPVPMQREATPEPKKARSLLERIRSGIRGWGGKVRLVGAEEHRCPYCLQPIIRGDPRGVKVCPVCHTRHHKDCWEITGMCQVPHLNR